MNKRTCLKPRDRNQTPNMLHPHLEIGREGVRQAHAAGERRQDEVAQLDARGRDDVAEAQVVVAQELREVVQQHQKGPEHALVQEANGLQKRRPAITTHGEFEMSRRTKHRYVGGESLGGRVLTNRLFLHPDHRVMSTR